MQYNESLEGIVYSVDCATCGVAGSPYAITATSTNSSPNYNISFIDTGVLTVNPFELTINVDDATITYGQTDIPSFGISSSPELLPYAETVSEILGDLTFSPSDSCTADTTITVSSALQVDNYAITYIAGNLTIENATLNLEIGTLFITQGESVPTNFSVVANGLVCDDVSPTITNFIIKDQNGVIQTGNLNGGTYEVSANLLNLSGYDNYTISQTPGSLFVNPLVGCNDRIKASGLCQSAVTLAGNPNIVSLLRFEYTNRLTVPIYIPNGPKNLLKGNAQLVGSPPELFLPGTHTFDIYTNGGRLQWEVITQGCNNASKSANGSNADPCDDYSTSVSADSTTEIVDDNIAQLEEIIEIDSEPVKTNFEGQTKLYPNPAGDFVNLKFGEKTGVASVLILDQTGRILHKNDYQLKESSNIQLDVSNYSPGILFFIYQHNDKREIFKIMKK